MAKLKYDDWPEYQNKKLRFKKYETEFEGVLLGINESHYLAVPDPKRKTVYPWVIKIDEQNVRELYPEDDWDIEVLE